MGKEATTNLACGGCNAIAIPRPRVVQVIRCSARERGGVLIVDSMCDGRMERNMGSGVVWGERKGSGGRWMGLNTLW